MTTDTTRAGPGAHPHLRTAARAERMFAEHPVRYRLVLRLLTGSGLAYGAFLLLVSVAGLALLLRAAFATGRFLSFAAAGLTIVFILDLIRSFIWRPDPPDLPSISREDAPALVALVERVREAARVRPLRRIMIGGEPTASVMARPDLDRSAPDEHYLVLGLPLLLALTPRELEAVLAHEFAHLSRSEDRAWFRLGRSIGRWAALLDSMDDRISPGFRLVHVFARWYLPVARLWGTPLARANELAADACAAELTGPEAVGTMLVRLEALNFWYGNTFLAWLEASADGRPIEEVSPYHEMQARIQAGEPYRSAPEALDWSLDGEPILGESHPATSKRLARLGVDPVPATPIAESAADALLAEGLDELLDRMDEDWRERAREEWDQRTSLLSALRERLAELEAEGEGISEEGLVEMGQLHQGFGDVDRAVACWESALRRDPGYAPAQLFLGAHRLGEGGAEGRDLVEAAMEGDPELRLQGYALLRDHCHALDQPEEAEAFHAAFVQELKRVGEAQEERATPSGEDSLEPHDLSPDEVARLVEDIREEPFIKEIYLVKRKLTRSEDPVYLVGIVGGLGSMTETGPERAARILSLITVDRPFQVVAFRVAGPADAAVFGMSMRKLRKAMKRVNGSRIF